MFSSVAKELYTNTAVIVGFFPVYAHMDSVHLFFSNFNLRLNDIQTSNQLFTCIGRNLHLVYFILTLHFINLLLLIKKLPNTQMDEATKKRMATLLRRLNPKPNPQKEFQEDEKLKQTTNPIRTTNPWTIRKKLADVSYAQPYQAEYQDCSSSNVLDVGDVDAESSLAELERVSTIYQRTEAETFKSNEVFETPVDEIIDLYFQPENINSNSKVNLPIKQLRSSLISSIQSYNVVIVEGHTGSGKSTQFPYYLLEHCVLELNQIPNIFVTQPRRIAARCIANRVCVEHNWTLGDVVGYQVGLQKVCSSQTMLTFCTAGVLLQKLIIEGNLDKYTHILIDEVHERDEDTDLLLMIIRKFMMTHKAYFRLVIMSATMNIDQLTQYFSVRLPNSSESIIKPIICRIAQPVSKTYEVETIHLERLLSAYNIEGSIPEFRRDAAEIMPGLMEIAVELIIRVIPSLDTYDSEHKSTLVFLPGMYEIDTMFKILRHCDDLDIIPLHSCISISEQNRVFLPSPEGQRKVILSTNLAESSITVTDVAFVIDFCLTKQLTKNHFTNFSGLRLSWSSRNQATQRAGRTGRCCPGKVFRMVSESFFNQLEMHSTPELLLAPLEMSILKIKRLDMGEAKGLLAIVIDPPPLCDIEQAVLNLKQIGALSSITKNDLDGQITPLGVIMSNLPIDVRLSKLIVLGHVFDVLKETVVIAACLSTNRTVVKNVYGDEIKSFENKFFWADGSQCDLQICLKVYSEYNELKRINMDQRFVSRWCESRLLDENKLREVSVLIEELFTRLKKQNICVNDQPNRRRDNENDALLLRIALCGAFFPNYFVSKPLDEEEVSRAMLENDSRSTVLIDGFPYGRPDGYIDQVQAQLSKFLRDFEILTYQSRVYVKSLKQKREFGLKLKYQVNLPQTLKWNLKNFIHDQVHDDTIMAVRFGLSEKLTIYKADCTDIEGKQTQTFADSFSKLSVEEQHSLNSGPYKRKGNEINIHKEMKKGSTEYLWGPSNPTKLSFSSILQRCENFTVSVERHSINSVLLDSKYKENKRWLLVGAAVTESASGGLIVRDSSLMPDIKGIGSIMSLLFAQNYVFKQNRKLNCVAGIKVGIGWIETTGESYNQNADADMVFDCLFDKTDFELINKCRGIIATIITMTNVSDPGKPLVTKQELLRELIITLLNRERLSLQTVNHNHLADNGTTDVIDRRPFMNLVLPKECQFESFNVAIRENVQHLKKICTRDIVVPKGGVYCYLCSSGYGKPLVMYKDICEHIASDGHIQALASWQDMMLVKS